MTLAEQVHQPDEDLRLVPTHAFDRPAVAFESRRIMDHYLAPLRLGHFEFAEFEGFQADLVNRSLVQVALGLGIGAAHLEARVGAWRGIGQTPSRPRPSARPRR